jgi:type III secretion system FlhB-like substrate exporter
MDKDIIEKLKSAKSADDLIAIAKKEGVEIAKEEAPKLFEKLKSGKLSEKDFGGVLGGLGDSVKKFLK